MGLTHLQVSKHLSYASQGKVIMQKCEHPRERILDIAEHLIMSRGFNRFSYKDISTEMKVKNAAIHYHFPIKK